MLTHEKQGVRKVTITRSQSGFGLTICGGADFPHKEGDSGIFVSELLRGDIDLLVGDRILEANDRSLREVTHDEAISALRSSPSVLRLIVESAQLEFNDSTDDLMALSGSSEPVFENGFIETCEPVVEAITEVDFGTREPKVPEHLAEPTVPDGGEPEEETSTASKLLGTIAFVALGAALIAIVLRKQAS